MFSAKSKIQSFGGSRHFFFLAADTTRKNHANSVNNCCRRGLGVWRPLFWLDNEVADIAACKAWLPVWVAGGVEGTKHCEATRYQSLWQQREQLNALRQHTRQLARQLTSRHTSPAAGPRGGIPAPRTSAMLWRRRYVADYAPLAEAAAPVAAAAAAAAAAVAALVATRAAAVALLKVCLLLLR